MAFESIFTRFCVIVSLVCCVCIQRSRAYKGDLTSSRICNPDGQIIKIKLSNDEESVALITDGDYFQQYTGRYAFNCRFQIKAKDNDDGLYAVIQDLNFRKRDGECLDYVEFSVPASNDLSKWFRGKNKNARKFCGRLGPGKWLPPRGEDESSDEELEIDYFRHKIAENGYIAPSGEITVDIGIATERLLDQKKLVISLAFTSYKKHCSKSALRCRIGECISAEFENDGVQNCPYESCADENGCAAFRSKTDDVPYEPIGSGIGTKVTFGAVGAILLILLKFGLCLWLCKRLHRRRARQQARQQPQLPPPDPMLPIPSAPPAEEIDTKDLPPAYDSLYPERVRQETHT